MRQANQPIRSRRKRCPCCGELFTPDPRTKGKQRYCSNVACQNKRQRQNELDWRLRNPECLEEQRLQSRQWHKERPRYSRQRRAAHPELAQANREQTQVRMGELRGKRMFDKSKSILTQLVGNTATSCYLSRSAGWLFLCLPKARSLFRRGCLGHNRGQLRRIENHQARLPAGRLYDLSGALK